MSPDILRTIFQDLQRNTSVTTLSICNSVINTDLQPILRDCIYHNNSLQFVYLNNINLGDNGSFILSENSVIVPLNTLSLESNQIGSVGGIALGDMLQRNTTLSTLFSVEITLENFRIILKLVYKN